MRCVRAPLLCIAGMPPCCAVMPNWPAILAGAVSKNAHSVQLIVIPVIVRPAARWCRALLTFGSGRPALHCTAEDVAWALESLAAGAGLEGIAYTLGLPARELLHELMMAEFFGLDVWRLLAPRRGDWNE